MTNFCTFLFHLALKFPNFLFEFNFFRLEIQNLLMVKLISRKNLFIKISSFIFFPCKNHIFHKLCFRKIHSTIEIANHLKSQFRFSFFRLLGLFCLFPYLLYFFTRLLQRFSCNFLFFRRWMLRFRCYFFW